MVDGFNRRVPRDVSDDLDRLRAQVERVLTRQPADGDVRVLAASLRDVIEIVRAMTGVSFD